MHDSRRVPRSWNFSSAIQQNKKVLQSVFGKRDLELTNRGTSEKKWCTYIVSRVNLGATGYFYLHVCPETSISCAFVARCFSVLRHAYLNLFCFSLNLHPASSEQFNAPSTLEPLLFFTNLLEVSTGKVFGASKGVTIDSPSRSNTKYGSRVSRRALFYGR